MASLAYEEYVSSVEVLTEAVDWGKIMVDNRGSIERSSKDQDSGALIVNL